MPMSLTIGFDQQQHAIDGKGWVITYADASGAMITTNHTTWTNAQGVAQDLFSDDAGIHAVLTSEAQATYLETNAGSVNTAITALRVAEGLDGPYP